MCLAHWKRTGQISDRTAEKDKEKDHMQYDYLLYAITEAYCIVFAITIWKNLSSSLGSEHEVHQLRNMIYAYLLMLVTDIVWALIKDHFLRLPLYLNASVNALSIMAISGGCYYWFRFIEDRTGMWLLSHKKLDKLIAVPMVMIWALDIISIFTGWIFYIDAAGNYQDNEKLFFLQTTVNYVYLVIPTVVSLGRAIKVRTGQERSEYLTYALYMAAPLTAGMLEEQFEKVPLLALNIFMMILILFLKIQNLRISNDALTGLNNRRRLDRYLEEVLSRASKEHPITLFITDINGFKMINDRYGHLEGDHALQLFAETLKSTAARYYGFAARYGGDEFCMIITHAGCDPQRVAQEISDALAKKQETREYTFTVSIGYACVEEPDLRPQDILAMADRMLYQNKKKWHALHDV